MEHTVIESKPDHFLDDLRLNSPWPELRSFAETIDLNVADSVVHKHTPYVIILLKVVDEWAKTHGGSLLSTREEKKEFKELIRAKMRAMDEDNYKEAVKASLKVFAPRGIRMSNNEVGLEVADVPSSSEMHESDSSDTENPPSSEDEESTPNLEHVLNYLNSFDMANGLRSGKVLTKKKRENASHKRHRKPQRKKDQSWRVGGEDGDGMPVVKSISEASEYGSSQNWIGPLAAHCGCHFLLVDHQTLNKYKVS